MNIIGGADRFRKKKKVRIKTTFQGTLRIPKVEFELLAVVFWCWLRKKQLNINAPIKVKVEKHLEDRDG